ncbi:Protein indeterminate-domain 4 chloroplastic [Heracleum sosnowskyi]|uniref:Protein indeterminate-domain 4 chloroplastic n=1 Tax=Heracleum sosnowskyi TaxID=360622 RepID=A0AAD8ILQ3_9APIA|nr:Protein indeterminate-domain 4 chloroplastic [Heracleum sosnowskyi]
MAAPSSATLSDLREEDLKNKHVQQLSHSPGEGASSDMTSSAPGAASQRRKRNCPGNPSPDAEVIELSPKTLMATNRFLCEVCKKGFQREQNLQLHRRGHNLPWKLKQKTNHEARRKVYICPELNCVHHDPARALGDLTAHDKICGAKEYKCECGTTFSRRDGFMYHRSFCDAIAEEVARHTTNRSPYRSMAASILVNASNPGYMSQGSTAAGSLVPGNHQQLSSPLYGLGATRPNSFTSLLSGQSIETAFQLIQPPNMSFHPGAEQKLSFPRAFDFSGFHGFPSCTASSNMYNFDINGGADLNSPQNDLDLNINNSFSGLLMNAEASACNILNSNPASPHLSATALPQKAAMTGDDSNNASLMKSMGSSFSAGMKLINYGGALRDGILSGGDRGAGSTIEGTYNNLNVSGGSYGNAGGMEYLSDQTNAPSGAMMYNVNNADGILVGEVNDNVLVKPQMNVQNEYCDKLTRDFLGMENRMNSLSGGGMVDDYSGNGMWTNSPDSEATTSAEVRPFVPGRWPGF